MASPLPASRDARAAAFESLVAHLQKNPGVQNMAMMTLTGFCRNCLAKWLLAARRRAGQWQYEYDDALREVYGMGYAEYKKEWQRKASEEEMQRFEASKGLWATHDKGLLGPPVPPPSSAALKGDGEEQQQQQQQQRQQRQQQQQQQQQSPPPPPSGGSGVVMSDVCCTDAEGDACAADMVRRVLASLPARGDDSSPAAAQIQLGVLTVSDRASAGVYEDESGPEVVSCVSLFAEKSPSLSLRGAPATAVVADEEGAIAAALCSLVDGKGCNVVFSTGGTGLSARDVTPEATLRVVDREVRGLPELVRRETSKTEPLAALSRAVAGIRQGCLIVNLPGRPKACREALAVLLPLLPHAVRELSK